MRSDLLARLGGLRGPVDAQHAAGPRSGLPRAAKPAIIPACVLPVTEHTIDRVEEDAELALLLGHLVRPVRVPEPAQLVVGRAGRDRVGLAAARLDVGRACSQLSLKPIPNPAFTSRTSAPASAADQDVADLVVHRVGPVHPRLLHEHAPQTGGGGDRGDLAGVVALHAADRDERVAALRERVGDEVLELARLVAAVGDPGVAVLALRPYVGTASPIRKVRGQALEAVHGRGPEEQRVPGERVEGHAASMPCRRGRQPAVSGRSRR